MDTRLALAVAQDYRRQQQHSIIASADLARLIRWVREHVSFAAAIPVIVGRTPDGARLCLVDGHRGIVLRYRVDGHKLAYYVMPEAPGGTVDLRQAIHKLRPRWLGLCPGQRHAGTTALPAGYSLRTSHWQRRGECRVSPHCP